MNAQHPAGGGVEAFEEAVLAAFGTSELARGSAAEITTRLLAAIESATGNALVYDFGALWYYDPTSGVWCELIEESTTRILQRLDGWAVIESGKSLKVGGGLWRDVWTGVKAAPLSRSGFFDSAARGLAFSDGFLRVRADGHLQLVPHAAEHRTRHAFPCKWDPDAECPRWLQALDEWGLDDDQRRFVAQWVGIALLGEMTASAKVLLLLGGGENGKSQFMDVISGLFPERWRSALGLHNLSDKFSVASLRDVRLNAFAETEKHDLMATGAFKAIVAGDPVKAEIKYGAVFWLRSRAAHLMSMNELPSTTDTTHGFWRRFEAIEFSVSFQGSPKRVEALGAKILADELEGLAAWAIYGAVDKAKHGWTEIDRGAIEEWSRREDTLGLWMSERTDADDETTWTSGATVYESFKDWCAKNGKSVWSSPKFGSALKGRLGKGRFDRKERGSVYRIAIISAPVAGYLRSV